MFLRSLWGNLLLFVGSTLVLNGIIFGLGWDAGSGVNVHRLLPPGWVVGAVWVLLFAGLGVARWLLLQHNAVRQAWLVFALGVLCLLYPLYTAGLSSERLGLIGNILIIPFAAYVGVCCWRSSRAAAYGSFAVVLWVCFATVALLT